jgi:uncharacterized membrane protein
VLTLIWTRHPAVFLHLVAAVLSLAVGILILVRRKGTTGHRAWGWAWVALMATTTISSAFIRDYAMPNIWGFTPIHLFTVWTAIGLPIAVTAAMRGNVALHRRAMKGTFIGGCVIAGIFTLVPGRFLGNLLWHQLPGLTA